MKAIIIGTNTDQELKHLQTAFLSLYNQLDKIGYLINPDHTIEAISDSFAKEFQVNRAEIIGQKITHLTHHHELQFYAQHQQELEKIYHSVFEFAQTKTTFQVILQPQAFKVFIATFYPLKNKNGEVIGIEIELRSYALTHLIELISVTQNHAFHLQDPQLLPLDLNERQKMILYLVSRNYSYSIIAMWMAEFGYKMSLSRVNAYLSGLKKRLGAANKTQLKEIAYKSGIMSRIPSGFFKAGIYDISDNLHQLVICDNYPLQDRLLREQFTPYYSPKTQPVLNYQSEQSNTFLSNYIASFYQFFNNSGKIGYVLDHELRVQALSDSFSDEFMLISPEQLINKPSVELYRSHCHDHPLESETIRSQDKQILVEHKPQIFLNILAHNNCRKAYIVYKYPILDAKQNTQGILVEIHRFLLPMIPFIIQSMQGFNVIPSFKWNNSQTITERQHMILFLYARNYSASEIANIITSIGTKITLGRVNEHLMTLKKKFAAKDEEQLRNVALLLGGYNCIPGAWLKSGSFNISASNIHHWIC